MKHWLPQQCVKGSPVTSTRGKISFISSFVVLPQSHLDHICDFSIPLLLSVALRHHSVFYWKQQILFQMAPWLLCVAIWVCVCCQPKGLKFILNNSMMGAILLTSLRNSFLICI